MEENAAYIIKAIDDLSAATTRLRRGGLVSGIRHWNGKMCALGAFEPGTIRRYGESAESLAPEALRFLTRALKEGSLTDSHLLADPVAIATWSNNIADTKPEREATNEVASTFEKVGRRLQRLLTQLQRNEDGRSTQSDS